MYKMKKKRLTAFLVCMTVLMTQIIGFNVSAKDDVYAEVVFGSGGKTRDMSVTHSFVPESAGGKEGVRSKKSAKAEFIYINISDSVLYDVPDDTPIDIVVEYFDDQAGGELSLTYDANRPPATYDIIKNNTIYKRSEDTLYLQGSGEWKTHTFHIEDLKAANRMTSSSDFRIGIWDPVTGFSPTDILIHSVKVQKSDFKSAVEVKNVYFDSLGHMYTKGDELVLKADLRNVFDDTVTFTGSAEVLDRYGKHYSDNPFSVELAPKEEKTIEIPLKNPEWYDLYEVKCTAESYTAQNPDKKYSTFFETDFSVSILLDAESSDPDYGNCIQVAKGYGDPLSVAEVSNRLGSSYVRDDVYGGNVSWTGTNYVVSDNAIAIWKTLREHGVQVIGSLTATSPYNAWDRPPLTDAEYAQHAIFCEQVASQLKGIVDVYNVWNEYNHSTFNKLLTGAEDYTKLLKVAYTAIKKGNPDAIVIGPDLAGVDHDFIETVCAEGGLDYMDGLSVHPYQWTGSFDPQLFIDDANKIKEIMRKYGDEKPMWITEFGFSSCGGKYFTVEEQYRVNTLARGVNKSFDLYDKYNQYCLIDRQSRTELEENWGFVNWWDEQIMVPYGAKYSFLAMSNFNRLAGKNAEAKEYLQTDDGGYLMRYYNKELKKDIIQLQTSGGVISKNLDLGCNEVLVLDGFGNEVTTLHSDNGIFGFSISNDPVWLVGNITKFKETESDAAVEFENLKTQTVAGDTFSFDLVKNVDKNLNIEIDGIEVAKNDGFAGNVAEIAVNIPADAEGEISFTVKAVDDDGNVYLITDCILGIIDTVDLKIETELANENNFSRWRIRATVTNMCETKDISGSFEITNPDYLISESAKRQFSNIAPGKSRSYLISLPEKVTKNAIDLETTVALDNGFKKSLSETLCFSASYYAYQKPTIDGVMSEGEWNSSWFGADEKADVKEIPDWSGPEDLSFSATSMWDEDNFYFVGVATDDVFYTTYTPSGASNMWRGDSFQLGFDDRDTLIAGTEGLYTELGMAYVPGVGDTIYRYSSLYGKPVGVIENCEIKIKRYDTYTLYECRIPWTEIFKDDYVFEYDTPFRFSALANDNDGNGRGWIEYMGGIGWPKTVTLFGNMTFIK